MSLPNSEDYQRLIQNPQNCFHDPVLKGGRPLNRPNQPIPRAFTGNFADVYQIISGSDKWAVKCFTREAKDICQRYSAIGDFLQKSKLSCMVEFDYLDRGMRVSGTAWVHVLKMRWVEGDSLNEFLFKYLDKPNILNTLAEKWLSLARDLTKAGMAHGDLQHGNVLLVPHANGGVSLKLIDYDGMFVPALAGHKANELGHPNFQHPLRGDDPFHADIDRFSHLVIFTAIRSLAATGDRTLWSRYENADNLLFTATDFKEPGESPVFKELWKLPDPDVHALVGHLILAALAPPRQTPLLPDLFDAAGVLPLTPQQVKEVEEQFKVKWKSLRSSSPASPSTAPVIVSPAATFTPLLPWMLQPAVRTPTPAPATAATATPAFPWTAVVASSPLTASAAPAIPRQLWVRQVGILVGRAYRGAKPLIDRIRQSTRQGSSLVVSGVMSSFSWAVALAQSQSSKATFYRGLFLQGMLAFLIVGTISLVSYISLRTPSKAPSAERIVDPQDEDGGSVKQRLLDDLMKEKKRLPVQLEQSPPVVETIAPLIPPTAPDESLITRHTSKSTGMTFEPIPAGTFLMGSSPTDVAEYLKADQYSKPEDMTNEQPQHSVRITRPFYMGTYEVTQGEYQKLNQWNPSSYSATGHRKAKVSGLDTTRFPVDQVSWYDAVQYCNLLSVADGLTPYYRITNIARNGDKSIKSATVIRANGVVSAPRGSSYRLPTEAEWEYASRAGTTTAFWFGSTNNGMEANVDGRVPFGATTKGPFLERSTTVGQYRKNKFGLCDTVGNTLEWCEDVFDDKAYASRNGTTDDPSVTTGSVVRVLRGGSWLKGDARSSRTAKRIIGTPGGIQYLFVGFRVVYDSGTP